MLKNKFYLALSLVILFALLLGGCNKMPDQKEASAPQKEASAPQEEAHWYDKYSLESDEVNIYIDDYELAKNPKLDKIHKNFAYVTVTDPQDIQALIDAVDFPAWRKAREDELYAGMEYYYVKFNDSTTIASYSDVGHAKIGIGNPDELGNLQELKATFVIPEKFVEVVQNLAEKQLKAKGVDYKLEHQN